MTSLVTRTEGGNNPAEIIIPCEAGIIITTGLWLRPGSPDRAGRGPGVHALPGGDGRRQVAGDHGAGYLLRR